MECVDLPSRTFICQKCDKKIIERQDLRGFSIDKGDGKKDIELEYYDVCEKCGLKEIKERRFKLRVAGAIEMGIISFDLFRAWQDNIISKKDFVETLQNNEKLFKPTKKEVI